MLGFGPTWMPQEDLTIFRRIQFSPDRAESYDPWIEKMTEKDRMLLLRASKPNMPRLEWHEVVPTVKFNGAGRGTEFVIEPLRR